MILQNILFPNFERCEEEALYFRKNGKEVTFDTYFNSFSVSKWKKYTELKEVALEIELTEKARVSLWHLTLDGEKGVSKRLIKDYIVEGESGCNFGGKSADENENVAVISFGELADDGIYAFSIKPENDGIDLSDYTYTRKNLERARAERNTADSQSGSGITACADAESEDIGLESTECGIREGRSAECGNAGCGYIKRAAYVSREGTLTGSEKSQEEKAKEEKTHIEVISEAESGQSDGGRANSDIKLAICICTFHREQYISRNMKMLRKEILDNPSSPLYGHLEVFISDNASSLDDPVIFHEKIHLISNRNFGGAGGFTTDLLKIITGNEKYRISHVILMDDDVTIEPDALLRTYSLLKLLKPEYKDSFVGGAMLRADSMYIQEEAGACWNKGAHFGYKHGADLRDISAVIENEIEEEYDYQAWWYCCFPISVAMGDNLPLPIFVRGDDAEYGLRNMKRLILLNGICLWHEPFENKYSSFLQYYLMRNTLLVNTLRCPEYGVKEAVRDIKLNCRQYVMFYRYKDLDLFLRGVTDFLKGASEFKKIKAYELQKELIDSGYKYEKLDKLSVSLDRDNLSKNMAITDSMKAKILRLATLNGLFLPPKGEASIPAGMARSNMTFRKKKVLNLDMSLIKCPGEEKGFVTVRSFRKSMAAFIKMRKVIKDVKRYLPKAQESYRASEKNLTSEEFWAKYLEKDLWLK